ncbi:hypothetical protein NBRC110019_20470 [Neptunitalea chrysea]|uniref:Uncharacterized protein n=1 Tax=Neptunitalea chrysea TaxID=1647581 RepID=A0A9W6B7W7_9FLAO|nr:hypothetical protein NBRC110019_20470 [Neptunitalea chrysea]
MHYNGEKIKRKMDNILYFDDVDDFLYNNFFNRKKSCHAVMVVNSSGEYLQYNGEYSENQLNSFITALSQTK